MRCLYCGKELALLKRLTGGGEFCSDAHKQSYQEEYNRLALSRLLQAQKKGHQASNSPSQNAPPPKTSVAVEEPEPEPVVAADRGVARDSDVPMLEVALSEARTNGIGGPEASPEEAVIDSEAVEDSGSVEEPSEENATEDAGEVAVENAEPEPVETAGFFVESPALNAPAEPIPHQESWQELSVGPAMSEWLFQNETFSLSPAELVSLELRPNGSSIDDRPFSAAMSAEVVTGAQPQPTLSPAGKAKPVANSNRLPSGGPTAMDIAPSSGVLTADPSLAQAIGFETAIVFDDSHLLELSPTSIDFPAADADVVVPASNRSGSNEVAPIETESGTATPETGSDDDSPRSSLEALSRLHQELVGQEPAKSGEAAGESDAHSVEAALAEVVEAKRDEGIAAKIEPEVSEQAEPVQAEVAPAGPSSSELSGPVEEAGPAQEALKPAEEAVNPTIDQTADPSKESPAATVEETEPASEPEKPKFAELFEISIKTFPPVKPALVGGTALASQLAPLLPQLKALPLRPKVALASGYQPPSATSAASETKPETSPATPTSQPVRTPGPSKPGSSGQQAARLTQPKPPVSSAKPSQLATKAPEPRPATPPKTVTTKTDATKQQAKPGAGQPKPVASTTAVQDAVGAPEHGPEVSPKATTSERERSAKQVPASEVTRSDTAKPASHAAKPKADTAKPVAERARPAEVTKPAPDRAKLAVDDAKKEDVPSFGIAQPGNGSWFSSLKVKLGIAIGVAAIAGAYFLGFGGGKSTKPGYNPVVSTDGTGPSIIMGEGGWVEGWGGDPVGLHVGRQITIYRPSLKLSDYRLEFQATIDVKSVGWVFRAADPDNYYAMKLMTVSSGLSTKVALFKYLVANGKQTQVGRVPIDMAVQPDTAFNIRVDVRGPQFTTYIQAQQVDSWTDDQLKIGGAGFLNEREERGKVKSVSIRYLSGAAK